MESSPDILYERLLGKTSCSSNADIRDEIVATDILEGDRVKED